MPSNVSYIMDESYNYSMWVEVFNPSNMSVNLMNYYFTDDRSDTKKWKPAEKNLAPKAFHILWFERDERAGHANFKLDPEGGILYIFSAGGLLIDSMYYPSQYRNISYGRKQDGGFDLGFFENPSPGSSNNTRFSTSQRCSDPVLSLNGGFYSTTQFVKFMDPTAGDTIYYTTDGSEPKITSSKYFKGSTISITGITTIRAKTISKNKLSSNIIGHTFFINQRKPKLPVVSIVTDRANLFDNTIGIYTNGTNGITGNGQTTPRNFNQDWDRPVNFEFFDSTGMVRVNRELDIKILGGWTRANPLKSIAISPKKKHGDNLMRYDFFAATKPDRKYKDIQMRNSGNDFNQSMMRDAFMQSLIANRMDLDFLAYEPAVIYINGQYYGIENLRERSNKDFMYSNFGLEDDKIYLIEATNLGVNTDKDMATDPALADLQSFAKSKDLSLKVNYDSISKRIDIDEFIHYMIAQIYIANTDWPYNNVKMWNVKGIEKWRWIYFDTDFGFSNYSHNSLTFALGENNAGIIGGYSTAPEWSVILFKRLILNEEFLSKFIDRFAIHISTTYETARVNRVMDSLSVKIKDEMPYHYSRWGGGMSNFNGTLNTMKNFAANRPANMLRFISQRFLGGVNTHNLKLSTNVPATGFTLNGNPVIESDATIKYFAGKPFSIKANPVRGYKFKHWQTINAGNTSIFQNGSVWSYFDGSSVPAANWFSFDYSDASWKSGTSPLGYGESTNATTISYGGNANSKYITSYFRKNAAVSNIASKTDFKLHVFVDDGAVVYVNGVEVGRINMPNVAVNFNTVSSSANEGVAAVFDVPLNLLREGKNVIAAEVHQYNSSSTDLIFDAKLMCSSLDSDITISTNETYSGSLNAELNLKAIFEKTQTDPDSESNIVINEVVASNSVIVDDFGAKDDYIEVYNKGDQAVNIAGWYFTDTKSNLTLHQISSSDASKTTVPAKGRLIFWADGEPGQGVNHLDFKLSKDGETVVLSRKDLQNNTLIVDSVTYPIMDANLSYSRLPDGGLVWMVQATTFNASNNISGLENLARDAFDVYPTLVDYSFNVVGCDGKDVIIRNITGKVITKVRCLTDNHTVYVDNLQKGIYLVTAGSRTIKIVRK